MTDSTIWLIKLLLAHLISDFGLQPDKWVKDRTERKARSPYLYLHTAVTGLIALLFIGPAYWQAVLALTLVHGLIDLGKPYLKAGFQTFLLDQAAHILTILAVWVCVFPELGHALKNFDNFYRTSDFWYYGLAVFVLTYPSSVLIGVATSYWDVAPGLKNAGKYIGIIERLLICVLVFKGQFEAIGLLMTGKSILRFNSRNEEAKTEYLLVGTLLSFLIAFAAGLWLKWVL